MTEPNDPSITSTPEPGPAPDPARPAAWGTPDPASADASKAEGGVASILESIKDAVDDLTVRATPAVREISAKAAELAAVAADKAAPFARRAGEVTADASGKLAEKSREWATDLRSTTGGPDGGAHDVSTPPADPGTGPDAPGSTGTTA